MNTLLDILPIYQLTWRDGIDLLLLTYLIYRLLLIIWGTIANKLLRVFGLLLILAIASDLLRLNTVRFLLQQSWEILLIVLLLVVQPELRQGVARMSTGLNFLNRKKAIPPYIDEVVKAASILSARRIGALIAIESSIVLRNYIEAGVEINADVKNELLRCIFFPDNPLHDGAVIISKERIAACSCFFPLARQELKSNLGTRHRAGLGMAEESDAFIIVVSEETGNISVARDGTLLYPLTAMQLQNELLLWHSVSRNLPGGRSK
jgi:diadenylate cyclase